MKNRISLAIACCIFSLAGFSQPVKVTPVAGEKRVVVTAGGQPFTEFIYPDSLEKPVLFPVYAPDGEVITRGFPLAPRLNEPIDHPHHIGLWMNYENVNGLDFWNNSSAIPAEKKSSYGWIKVTQLGETTSSSTGSLVYYANWQDIHKNTLLQETTTFYFTAKNNIHIIDRVTTLTASQDVTMPDIKDGFLGLRVAHELELRSKDDRVFTDAQGNVTKVKAADDTLVSGNYITSNGYTGDAAWGTRGAWCMLYGKKGKDSISIVMIDHPKNIGYPTYWHARGYGLFSANPLGQKIFSNGKETLNYSLKKGEAVTFRFRVVVNSGSNTLTAESIEALAKQFAY